MKHTKTYFSILILAITASSFAQVSSSAIIKKYNRKMVFSKTEIKPGSENEASFTEDYQPGDELYYRVYMDSTIQQFLSKWRYSNKAANFKSIEMMVYLDDKYIGQFHKSIATLSDDDFLKTSAFGSAMYSANAGDDAFSFNKEFKEFTNSNSAKLQGNHKMKIMVYMFDNKSYYQLYATGFLNIKTDKDAMAKVMGITGEFHKEHLKQIVFSSNPINDNPTAANLITEYHIGQPLYYRLFMDNSIENMRKKLQNSSSFKQIYCFFYIDGNKIKEDRFNNFSNLNMTDEQYKTITTIGGIMMSDKEVEAKETFSIFNPFLNLITTNDKALKGTHKLKIELYLYGQGINQIGEKLGEGELTLVLGTVSKTNHNLCFTPKAVMSDPTVEAKMITAYNDKFSGKSVAKKAYLMYKDWEVVKNELGVIICKARSATMEVQGSDGTCAYSQVSFKMDYEGAGKYGNIIFSGLLTGGYTPVLCECEK